MFDRYVCNVVRKNIDEVEAEKISGEGGSWIQGFPVIVTLLGKITDCHTIPQFSGHGALCQFRKCLFKRFVTITRVTISGKPCILITTYL